MQIHGNCHCGNIGYTLDWLPEPTEIPARACGCSFCVKHGGVWTSCPTGALSIRIASRARHSVYAFGTRTADFHVCATCGAVPVVTSTIAGRTYAVVNVNAMEGVPASMFRHAPVSFDGEDETTRLARRVRGWIPRVAFEDGGA